jgi:DNA-binding transcriptional MocR family regulator
MEVLVAALRRQLPDWSIDPPDGGWSLWITPPTGSAAAFTQTALRHGVAIVAGSASRPDEAFPDCVRICFGAAPPLLEDAARRLASAWSELVPNAPPVAALAGS